MARDMTALGGGRRRLLGMAGSYGQRRAASMAGGYGRRRAAHAAMECAAGVRSGVCSECSCPAGYTMKRGGDRIQGSDVGTCCDNDAGLAIASGTYMVMTYIVMAYIAMATTRPALRSPLGAYIVMACKAMATTTPAL